MINRRRILTGLVAAPFVARLGLLMPVRPVTASGGLVALQPAYRIDQNIYSRVHYAIGLDGAIRIFLDHEMVGGQVPRLRPDHPLAQIDGQWDFTTLAESGRLGPVRAAVLPHPAILSG